MFGGGSRFLRAFLRKCRRSCNSTELLNRASRRCRVNHHHEEYYCCLFWFISSSCRRSSAEDEEANIPSDVPKGHMVVYVGEARKRFVIRVSFLDHPLFRALLDEAQEEYEFNNCHDSNKLCIPCHENSFLALVRFVSRCQQADTTRTTNICTLCF